MRVTKNFGDDLLLSLLYHITGFILGSSYLRSGSIFNLPCAQAKAGGGQASTTLAASWKLRAKPRQQGVRQNNPRLWVFIEGTRWFFCCLLSPQSEAGAQPRIPTPCRASLLWFLTTRAEDVKKSLSERTFWKPGIHYVCQEWRKKVRLATKAAKEKSMMSRRAAWRFKIADHALEIGPTNIGLSENKWPPVQWCKYIYIYIIYYIYICIIMFLDFLKLPFG